MVICILARKRTRYRSSLKRCTSWDTSPPRRKCESDAREARGRARDGVPSRENERERASERESRGCVVIRSKQQQYPPRVPRRETLRHPFRFPNGQDEPQMVRRATWTVQEIFLITPPLPPVMWGDPDVRGARPRRTCACLLVPVRRFFFFFVVHHGARQHTERIQI